MEKKEELYKKIRIASFATFIPFVLISGPIGGYIAGDFLRTRFNLPGYVVLIALAVGSLASFLETFRIIRTMLKLDKKDLK